MVKSNLMLKYNYRIFGPKSEETGEGWRKQHN